MKIQLASVFVDDQEKALRFYTDILGFIKKQDIPAGKFRFLTVVSAEGPDDIELLLEPNENLAAKTFQDAIFQQGIPMTAFSVADVHNEFETLKQRGVVFRGEPMTMGPVTLAVLEDTCGNLIQIYQVKSP